jgi:hypothetical protein
MSPEGMTQVRLRFLELEKYLGLQFEDISAWTPSDEDVKRVKFCLARATEQDVQAALFDSMDKRQVEITSVDETATPGERLIETTARLRKALRSSQGNRKRQTRLWAEFESRLDDAIGAPLVRRALAVMDPAMRSRLFAIAGINRIVYPATEVVSANLTRQIAKCGVRGAKTMLHTELEPLLKFYTVLLQLIKAEI